MNDIANDLGGFRSAGWQPASSSQVCNLFAHVQAPSPCPGSLSVYSDAALAAEILDLMNLLGVTWAKAFVSVSAGFYEGSPEQGLGVRYVFDVPSVPIIEVSTWLVENLSISARTRLPDAGHFLVKVVPEPSPVVLATIGLMLVRVACRTHKARQGVYTG